MSDLKTHVYDVSIVAPALQQLHEHVTRTKGRIEITRPGSNERCLLISKEDLEAIERTLAILSNTEDVRVMCDRIAQLAAVTGPMSYLAV